ncbi:MAG TPA: glycoside hydrolase family 125 protein [Candidatus Eremiobacteraceae bacterium]|nr:glycoside hydrolase family 125 protein [Candidatus Eremiobacteraceae bacterium]
MALLTALGGLLTVLLSITPALPDTLVSIYNRAAAMNAALFFAAPDKTTYVSTGDIDAMWLRDSSIQTRSILHDRRLARGVIARQERLIVIDPYANAFSRGYLPIERKFEIDSLCYPVLLADDYGRAASDRGIYDHPLLLEMRAVLHTLEVEQHHATMSSYHHNEHPIDPTIGLVWSAYRPSDEAQSYNYNIPENMLASVTLRTIARLMRDFYADPQEARRADGIADRIDDALAHKAVFNTMVGRIYAYEIDGRGHAKFMDDANTPSLLSVPLFGYRVDPGVYATTRRFILSSADPYYYRGRFASGIGSSHTPGNYVWPLSLVVEYRTATDNTERRLVVAALAASSAGDGALHESFDVNDPRKYTRESFGWVNALFEQTFKK